MDLPPGKRSKPATVLLISWSVLQSQLFWFCSAIYWLCIAQEASKKEVVKKALPNTPSPSIFSSVPPSHEPGLDLPLLPEPRTRPATDFSNRCRSCSCPAKEVADKVVDCRLTTIASQPEFRYTACNGQAVTYAPAWWLKTRAALNRRESLLLRCHRRRRSATYHSRSCRGESKESSTETLAETITSTNTTVATTSCQSMSSIPTVVPTVSLPTVSPCQLDSKGTTIETRASLSHCRQSSKCAAYFSKLRTVVRKKSSRPTSPEPTSLSCSPPCTASTPSSKRSSPRVKNTIVKLFRRNKSVRSTQ
ncbi:uncharacterized protein BYT42DRAFT_648175 [Radiomyces spectabilis]|uniref:uncharacterized protein n=1 Tax=Radiomyces spectabilis TaxID=64574 RepID=UPI00221F636A|nr:uncharacterized protein BYT42DRAFT_648175 [Radiomyces spectabilis]KAI8369509.1 hypothetical protein BYT42DRAFT_648175 [Radiomyces spectabilis]